MSNDGFYYSIVVLLFFFVLFPISEASIRAPRARYMTKLVRGITSRLTPDLGRVFYSFDKCFETGADPRNKKFGRKKFGRHVCRHFNT